jgi:hypothetical protein
MQRGDTICNQFTYMQAPARPAPRPLTMVTAGEGVKHLDIRVLPGYRPSGVLFRAEKPS